MKTAPGTLPRPQWLKAHGYGGLDFAMRHHPEAFAHIRQNRRITSRRRSLADWVLVAENLAEERGGFLPPSGWLQRNGYNSLEAAMRRCSKAFAHLKQDRKLAKRRTLQGWVVVAETMARKHDDQLPHSQWLREHGYSSLVSTINKHPEAFAHIRRDRRLRLPIEWVPVAAKLAEEHGALPPPAWLKANGYCGLAYAVHCHNELFANIPRRSMRGRTPKEWVAVAERLAQEHGALPMAAWLNKNGYSGCQYAIRHHPSLFQHIPKDYGGGRKPEEWLALAEQLAKSQGALPREAWLNKNGHSALASALRQHPHLFQHIRQAPKQKRSSVDWVPHAVTLAKKHGGTLPSQTWLSQNGYSGLAHAITRKASLFAHIEQDRCNYRTPEEWVSVAEQLANDQGTLPCYAWLSRNGYRALLGAMSRYPRRFQHIPRDEKRRRTPEEWVPIAKEIAAGNGGVLPNLKRL